MDELPMAGARPRYKRPPVVTKQCKRFSDFMNHLTIREIEGIAICSHNALPHVWHTDLAS
jgi:hypothetical protein